MFYLYIQTFNNMPETVIFCSVFTTPVSSSLTNRKYWINPSAHRTWVCLVGWQLSLTWKCLHNCREEDRDRLREGGNILMWKSEIKRNTRQNDRQTGGDRQTDRRCASELRQGRNTVVLWTRAGEGALSGALSICPFRRIKNITGLWCFVLHKGQSCCDRTWWLCLLGLEAQLNVHLYTVYAACICCEPSMVLRILCLSFIGSLLWYSGAFVWGISKLGISCWGCWV